MRKVTNVQEVFVGFKKYASNLIDKCDNIFPFVLTLILVFSASFLLGPGQPNEDIHLIGTVNSGLNNFSVYTFKNNQHRCFIVMKYGDNVNLECP